MLCPSTLTMKLNIPASKPVDIFLLGIGQSTKYWPIPVRFSFFTSVGGSKGMLSELLLGRPDIKKNNCKQCKMSITSSTGFLVASVQQVVQRLQLIINFLRIQSHFNFLLKLCAKLERIVFIVTITKSATTSLIEVYENFSYFSTF